MIISTIGNKPPDHDASAQIDAADLVVRISKMDYLDTGWIGRRTDELYLEPNLLWWRFPAANRRLNLFPAIPAIRIRESWWLKRGHQLLNEGIVMRQQVQVIPADVEAQLPGCTTFAMATYDLHRRFPDATLMATGADFGEARLNYFGRHTQGGEIPFLDGLIDQGILLPI